MKKVFSTVAILFIAAFFAVNAHADLGDFLSDLNIQARADMNGFEVRVSNQFGVPLPQVQSFITTVGTPSDAFMCFQLGKMTGMQPERVFQTYKSNKGKGWGVIAKELGIKPGSAEFHALKQGNFYLTGAPEVKSGKGQKKGKHKEKEKEKKNKGKDHKN